MESVGRGRVVRTVLVPYAIAYAACLLAFCVLLLAVWSIPKSLIFPQVERSAQMLAAEGDYPTSIVTTSQQSDMLDSFSTALALNIAIHGTGHPVRDALLGAYCLPPGGWDSFTKALGNSLTLDANVGYARYWHGYLVVLIPLLVVWDLAQIRAFVMLVLAVLTGLAVALLGRRVSPGAGTALTIALTSVNLWATAFSVQLSFCFLVALVGICLMAWWARPDEGLSNRPTSWGVCFFVLGAVTVYVDFLDTPLVSLGLPLAACVALRAQALRRADYRELVCFLAVCIVSWGAGYALLWVSKWVLSALILGPSALMNVAQTASMWTHLEGGRQVAIMTNVNRLLPRWARLPVAVTAALWALVWAVRRPTGSAKVLCALLVVAALPAAWYLALANHSTVHEFFVYRCLCVSVFALCLVPVLTLRREVGTPDA